MKSQTDADMPQKSVRTYFAQLAWQRRPPTAMLSYAELDVESYFVGLRQPPPLLNSKRKESARSRTTLVEMFAAFRSE